MEPTLPPDFDFDDGVFGSDLFNDDSAALNAEGSSVQGFTSGVNREISMMQRRKDEKMANDDPMRYCADRCVSTGNCDVFEDMFDLGEFFVSFGLIEHQMILAFSITLRVDICCHTSRSP